MKTILAILITLISFVASAEELRIAAASDLNFAMQEIAKVCRQKTGNTLKISFGSSGNFFAQIQNGAPFDVYFSADMDFPRQLEKTGFAEPGTLYQYAVGKIVLWVPHGSKLDLSKGMNVLLDPAIRRIAIANPKHAPYGRAAEAAMRKSGVYDHVAAKLVVGENISQAAQFVDTGNADIGLLALSLAVSPTMQLRGRYVEIAPHLYPPLEQAAVIVKASPRKALARQFMEFFKEPEAQSIMRRFGFQPALSK